MGMIRNAVTEAWEQLAGIVDLLFGCSHRKTTFPRSHPPGEEGGTESATYVACLQCGRQVPYDWTTMRAASSWRSAGLGRRPVSNNARR
jgi:hypothetical protein